MENSIYKSENASCARPNLKLTEILGALSHALDLTEGQPQGHCVRCCWIGSHIGAELGLTGQAASDLFFTMLLKDLGCSSNAARICQLYLTDDITFKRDFKTIDDSLPAALKFVFNKTGLKVGLAEKLRTTANALINGTEISRELIETRCHRGADIAAKMRFSTCVQDGIRSLDEHWNGSGRPEGLVGKDIPLNAQIALLSQIVDVFQTEYGPEAAVLEAQNRSGKWFDPALVQAFMSVEARAGFWDALQSDDAEARILAMAPDDHNKNVDDDYLDDVASAFADVIDAKSPFTAGHSKRVTIYTDMIAEALGMTPPHRRWLRRAALLHDIGKLAVSNQILDKPGKPTEEEWAAIKSHASHSREILQHVSAFADLAPIAGGHHERLDGRGYPQGLKAAELPIETRIVTVADIFDALSADRPYRAAMPVAKALSIMREDVGAAIDAACFDALCRALEQLGDGKVVA